MLWHFQIVGNGVGQKFTAGAKTIYATYVILLDIIVCKVHIHNRNTSRCRAVHIIHGTNAYKQPLTSRHMNKSSATENTDTVDHYRLFCCPPRICCVQLVIVQQASFVAHKNWENNLQMTLPLLAIFSSGNLLKEILRKTVCVRTKQLCRMLMFVALESKEQYELQSHLLLGESSNSPAVHVKINQRLCLCVRRSRLHHLDAVSQPKLLHQPVDLHGVLQQRVQRAAESAALPVGARPPRLPA